MVIIMNKILLSTITILLFLSLSTQVRALENDTLTLTYNQTKATNGLSIFNETFTSAGNKTFYVNLPKNSTVTNAKLNVNGYTIYTTTTLNETNGGNIGDDYINSFNSDSNYGTQEFLCVWSGGPQKDRTLILWNLSSVSSISTITNANLSLYMRFLNKPNKIYDAYNTSIGWTETGVTWNNQPSTSILQSQTNIGSTEGTRIYWNILPAVISSVGQTMSIMIKDDTEGDGDTVANGMCSKDFSAFCGASITPQLVISYTNIPSNPTLSISNQIWNYTGTYNANQQTNDFSSELNSYLKTCSPYTDGTCDVPFTVHSDSAGILNINLNTTITYDTQTFDSEVYEGQNSNFWIQVNSTPDITDVNGYLIWNGTSYPYTSKNQVGTYWTFNRLLTIPSASADENISFYWSFDYTNTTGTFMQNFSSNEQTLYPFSVTNCTGGDVMLNFTTYDEETQAQLNFSMDLSMNYWLGNSYKNFSYSYSGNNTYYLCINPTTASFLTTTTIKYWETGYTTRYHYLENYLVSNNTSNIHMYLLNSSSGQNVLFTTYNNQNFAVPDVFINIQRQIGTDWVNVTNGITDTTGAYTFFLNPTTKYQITFTSSYGVKTILLIPSLTTYVIYVDTTSVPAPSYWSYYKQASGSCTFNNDTRKLQCSWTDTSGHLENAYLKVVRNNKTSEWTLCDNSSTLSNGTLVCDFGIANNNSFVWTLYGQFSSEPTKVPLDSGDHTDLLPAIVYGTFGLFVTLFIVLCSGLFGVQTGNPIVTVLFSVIGVGFSMILGFLTFELSATTMFLGLCVAAGVEIYKLRSEHQ